MFERFFVKKEKPKDIILEKKPEGDLENEVTDLQNGHPDFMGFGEGTKEDLIKKIRNFTINSHKSEDEQKIQKIEEELKNKKHQ